MSTTKSVLPEPSWPEMLGSKNWEGLLDPLDLSLRRFILRCGDFCQATYDAFNNDGNSKYAGSSRYGKDSFFRKTMLPSASDYQVHCFLYATAKVEISQAMFVHSMSRESWDRESNWIGYIATTTDEASRALGRREIYVVWRGTSRNYEWINVFDAAPKSVKPLLRPQIRDVDEENLPKVMNGYLTIYISTDPGSTFTKLSARAQLRTKIHQLREQYRNESLSITFTGHSLGASLSIISAFDVVENGVNDIPVTAIVFGSPQVGNEAFKNRVLRFPNLKVLHVRNKIDLIPMYPSALLGYRNVGVELEIDHRKSTSLKDSQTPGDWHNLQAMLHVVAGWDGPDGDFELKVRRSLALVNKSSSILKDEYLIPGSWWVEKNKGMKLLDGEWVLEVASDEDQPVAEF